MICWAQLLFSTFFFLSLCSCRPSSVLISSKLEVLNGKENIRQPVCWTQLRYCGWGWGYHFAVADVFVHALYSVDFICLLINLTNPRRDDQIKWIMRVHDVMMNATISKRAATVIGLGASRQVYVSPVTTLAANICLLRPPGKPAKTNIRIKATNDDIISAECHFSATLSARRVH